MPQGRCKACQKVYEWTGKPPLLEARCTCGRRLKSTTRQCRDPRVGERPRLAIAAS